MKRISKNRDLFEANPDEVIVVTVEASNTPYQATFSDLESGGQWTPKQSPSPAQPTEKRQFKMPHTTRELFTITYAFPPNGQINENAKYLVTFTGAAGTSDGPNDVLPPASGDTDDLPYEFRLPRAAPANLTPTVQTTAVPAQKSTRTKTDPKRS